MPTTLSRSRARDLLQKVLSRNEHTPAQLAEILVIPEPLLQRFLIGTQAIPLDRQLCLALFLIEKVPALARAGHQLRAQVLAAVRFTEHSTEVHREAPLRM